MTKRGRKETGYTVDCWIVLIKLISNLFITQFRKEKKWVTTFCYLSAETLHSLSIGYWKPLYLGYYVYVGTTETFHSL